MRPYYDRVDRMKAMKSFLILLSLLGSYVRSSAPPSSSKRRFIQLPGAAGLSSQAEEPLIIRIQQYNVLADGLSALRPDLGGFSRASREVLDWESRRHRLLSEIKKYDADVITLQEVDHYYDFFLPEMNKLGYIGHFAPKPTSACLEVSGNNDGCAMFIRRSRMRVISCETTTLALSVANLEAGEIIEDEESLKLQNQVGLITVCEFICGRSKWCSEGGDGDAAKKISPPPLIICTTHLKASKTSTGERYRQKGVQQILAEVNKIYQSLAVNGRRPPVILTGDFNAVSNSREYLPLTYEAVKRHRLGLRSVYNEDVPLSSDKLSSRELYTVWKYRRRGSKEVVVKRCIDYIFYGPAYLDATGAGDKNFISIINKPPIVAFSDSQLATSLLLRSAVYLFGAVIPVSSIFSSGLELNDKIFVVSLSVAGLAIFEIISQGTIFKPIIAARPDPSRLNGLKDSDSDSGPAPRPSARAYSGMRAVAALDIPDDLGDDLMPSEAHPSDHLSIAADLQIVW